ncbi:MAG: ribbon-helix-helix protein, CopG family [Methyloceanibacter sp.]
MTEKSNGRVFPERFNLKVPQGFSRALAELADKQHTTRSEVVRQALLREVEANGLQLAPAPPTAATKSSFTAAELRLSRLRVPPKEGPRP